MTGQDLSLNEALRQAQEQDVVERDPSLDIEGMDIACKLQILAGFGLDLDLRLDDLSVHGIQDLTAADLREWRRASLRPKLVSYLIRGAEVRAPASEEVSKVQRRLRSR